MYLTVLQGIKSKLEEELKDIVKQVFIMGGGFGGIEDIKNYSIKAPAIGIGLSGIPSNFRTNSNQLESMLDLSIFVLTTQNNKPKGSAEIEMYELIEKINLLIMNGNWGLNGLYATEQNSITGTSFYGPEIYKNNLCMWEITWQQKCVLGADIWEGGDV